ncbi:MAG: glucokinase, partial [Thermoanaerobaculia bacterium]
MILAGDIGGTKTTLALFATNPALRGFEREPAVVESFESRAFSSFEEVLQKFLARHQPRLLAGCIGIAGPVRRNRCEATNLPWSVDGAELARLASLSAFHLLNDLEAVGFGLDLLRPDEVVELQAGESGASGHRAVIAAGTGLGEAGLFWDGTGHRPFATEGGHADFAPRDDREWALLRFLRKEHERVSWERVISGPGLVNLYRFVLATNADEKGCEPPESEVDVQAEDAAAVISHRAQSGESPLCGEALDLFVRLYGAEAGNLALKTLSTGGLYIGGGIAPKILD